MSAGRFDAVISDIDGCLCPETAAPIDVEAIGRIAAHNRVPGGLRVTLCSGRPQPFAEAMCRFLANTTLPIVAENGVWLYHPAENRYDMDPAITPSHLAAVQAAREWVARDLGPRDVVMQPGKFASISLYHPDAPFLRSLEAGVRARFEREGWPLRVSMTWFYINCDLTHISKGTGLERLIAAAGLDRTRLAGIGDTLSDLAIADRVAFFACPANADERVKARANYVSPHEEARGVVDILSRLG